MQIPLPLQEALNEFNATYPRPGIEPLVLSKPYDLQQDWPTNYPFMRHKGVYCFVDEAGTLTYVGKVSCRNDFGYRLAGYFEYGPDRRARAKHSHHAATRYIYVISLPSGHEFEAPAIEEWLISRLNPPLNKVGRRGAA